MRQRIISALIIAAIMFVTIVLGGPALLAVVMGASFVAYYELTKAIGVNAEGGKHNRLQVAGYIAVLLYYLIILFIPLDDRGIYMTAYMIALILINMALLVFAFPKYSWQQVMGNIVSIIYGAIMISFIYSIRVDFKDGMVLCGLVAFSCWISDVCAFFTGVYLGKHKLAPVLSPKKSIEGSIGGIVGAMLTVALYAWVLSLLNMAPTHYVGKFMIMGAIGSLISQIGDLAASAIKRQVDLKDYGTLIPGHGGIMDRFDSIIFTAPVIYIMSYFLIGP